VAEVQLRSYSCGFWKESLARRVSLGVEGQGVRVALVVQVFQVGDPQVRPEAVS
jgi:hypothetical protein